MSFNVYASMAKIGDIWNEKRIVGVMPSKSGKVLILYVPAAGGIRGQLQETLRDGNDRLELFRR